MMKEFMKTMRWLIKVVWRVFKVTFYLNFEYGFPPVLNNSSLKKITRNQATLQKSYQRDQYLVFPNCKILGIILKVYERRTSTYGPGNKETHEALHQRDGIDRQYVSIEGGWRGLTYIKNNVDTSIRRLEDNIKKNKERLLTATRNHTNNIRTNRTTINIKEKWEEKQLYGYFKRQTSELSHEKTWTWLRKGNIKRKTEFSSNSTTKTTPKGQTMLKQK